MERSGLTQRLLTLLTIGGGSADESRRCLPAWMDDPKTAWREARARVSPLADGVFLRAVAGLGAYDAGVADPARLTDIGPTVDGPHLRVEVDGLEQARLDGFGWLADTFADAWAGFNRPLVAYLGSLPFAWRRRTAVQLREAVAPLLAAGPFVSPGFDCAPALLKYCEPAVLSPTYRLARDLRREGVTVYGEAPERIEQSFWLDLGLSLCGLPARIDECYRDPDRWMIARDVRGGDYMALVGVDDKAERLTVARRYWARGLSVAMYTFDMDAGDFAAVKS